MTRTVALALLALACRPTGGTVEMQWTGSDTGHASIPATARRCAGEPLEIVGVSGDTGIAIGLFMTDTVPAGEYPIDDPDVAGVSAPAASLGARWLDSAAVRAWRAVRGSVTVQEVAGELTGEFSVEARTTPDGRQANLVGAIRGVRVDACGAAADSGG